MAINILFLYYISLLPHFRKKKVALNYMLTDMMCMVALCLLHWYIFHNPLDMSVLATPAGTQYLNACTYRTY